MRRTTTAASTRSPRCLGKTLPRLGSPTRWPARPMRWSPLATEPGDSTCTTRSMAPMSMPSSSDEVATRARRRPALSWSSMSRRCSRLSDPWWARTSSPPTPNCSPPTWAGTSPVRSAPSSSLRRAARRSARRRELTKTRVERWAWISSSRRGCTDGQIDVRARPAAVGPLTGSSMTSPMRDRSSTGTTTSTSMGLRRPASTIVTGRQPASVRPPRKRAISSRGRWVADRPMRWGAPLPAPVTRCSRRSRDRARWAPRLVAARAWISSTITQRTPARVSRAREVSMRNSDSGVVMSTSGGRRTRARRSSAAVSPVRIPTLGRWTEHPRRSAARVMPASGARRLRSTSTARARRGET